MIRFIVITVLTVVWFVAAVMFYAWQNQVWEQSLY